MRLSIMSFAGTVRTLVAVGTVRLWSMLVASVLLMPRSGLTWFSGSAAGWSVTTGVLAVCGASAGIGCGLAGAELVRATGAVPVVELVETGAVPVVELVETGAGGVSTGSTTGEGST